MLQVTLLETRITSKLLGTQALAEPSAKAAAVPVVTSAKTGLPGTTVCSVKAQGLPAQLTTLGCAAWQAANAFKASLVLPGMVTRQRVSEVFLTVVVVTFGNIRTAVSSVAISQHCFLHQ